MTLMSNERDEGTDAINEFILILFANNRLAKEYLSSFANKDDNDITDDLRQSRLLEERKAVRQVTCTILE